MMIGMKSRKETIIKKNREISRREFMGGAAAAAMAFTIVPRHVLGGTGHTPPSEKLNVAGVGIGGMGKSNINKVAGLHLDANENPDYESMDGENIVALCDVDNKHAAETFKLYPKAKKYQDYRKMLEKQKDIDAVVIATPDHTHAVIAMMAMQMGKHVYCQKPLTHSIYEARKLTETARKYKVAAQMGIQGHSSEGIRLICEWIWDGAIGSIQEVHAWTNRPMWPQGMDRPKEMSPVPETLDWDLWLGPAPYRPYHPCYTPFSWRGWQDFGTGALGDMGCHALDLIYWSIKLGYPSVVEGSCSRYLRKDWDETPNNETFPRASIVRYEFPARGNLPPVKLTWYDGGLLPPRPEELEEGRQMGVKSGGILFCGDKGKLACGYRGQNPRIIPEKRMKEYKRPPKTLPRIPEGEGGHEENWVIACKGGPEACANFDYSGPLTEVVLLGNVAMRFPGKRLKWDGPGMKCTNLPEANEYIHRQYRDGWTL
jgi:predicted dehydrogenase